MDRISLRNYQFFRVAQEAIKKDDQRAVVSPHPRSGLFGPLRDIVRRQQEQRAMLEIQKTTGATLYLATHKTTRRGEFVIINGNQLSWDLPSIAAFRHLRSACLTDGCDSLPDYFDSSRYLQTLFLRECNSFRFETLKSTCLLRLSIEDCRISEDHLQSLLFSIIPEKLPSLQIVGLSNVGLMSFKSILHRRGHGDESIEFGKVERYDSSDDCQETESERSPWDRQLSEIFQQRTLKMAVDAETLEKTEDETRAIEFLQTFKMPAIEIKFVLLRREAPGSRERKEEYLHRISHAWQLNTSGVTMLLASLNSADSYYGTIPFSLWPTVLEKKRRKRPVHKTKYFTDEDAVFHLLKRCPGLFCQS